MERYKKRTIALCLASLLTVVGAFGEENYNNTLMELKVNVGSGGYVNLTAFTQKPYNNPLKAKKIDENTFVITLNETNNNASAPDIEGYENIESIQISTYPYTTEAEGCTRIVVKTSGEPTLTASQALYITDKSQHPSQTQHENEIIEEEAQENYNAAAQNTTTEENSNNNAESTGASENIQEAFTPPESMSDSSSGGASEYMTVLLWISVLLMLIGFIFIFSRDKMATVVGDQGELDVENKNKNKKQGKIKKIKSTINKLDRTYSNKQTSSDFAYTQTNETDNNEEVTENIDGTQEEVQNVVDLDLLYQETQKSQQEAPAEKYTEDDLADLLSSFALEEAPEEEAVEEESFDEEFYNEVINSKKLKFSNDDIQKISKLMQFEISSETLNDLKKYLSNPKKKPPTKEQILADLISTYSIKQNISFSHEDVQAIEKLMNVELGPDFTKDFTTNPLRTKIAEKKIKESTGKKPHRTSEIITLSVKDMLPDLSKELEKQGGKRIKSEAKPTVVYYSEGYEYQKLHVSEDLSDIMNDTAQNEYKPSYEAPVALSGYEVSTLAIKDELPNLDDAKAHPNKYEKTVKKQKADENALLKSIANVTFKPFYEESESEINQFDEDENPDINEEKTENFKTTNDDNAKKLLKLIEEQKTERKLKQQAAADSELFKKELEAAVEKNKKLIKKENESPKSYNLNGKNVELIKTVKCTKNSECKIVHTDNKYIVLGNIDNREIVLREYESLKNKNMYIRLNDKSDKTKYLVKVGSHKFLINVTNDNMEFVMDLC